MTPKGIFRGGNMTGYGYKIGRVILPLLLHTAISFGVAFAAGILKSMNGLPGTVGTVLNGSDSTLVTVVTAAVSLPVFWNIWKKDRVQFPLKENKKAVPCWIYATAFLGGILASCAGSYFMDLVGIEQYFSNRVQEELLSAGFWLQVFGLGMIVPILEELLYRGVMYQRLREFLAVKPAIVSAALIFALAHGNMIQFLYALPMALILLLLCEKSGKLTVPILFHMGANLISVFINYYSRFIH